MIHVKANGAYEFLCNLNLVVAVEWNEPASQVRVMFSEGRIVTVDGAAGRNLWTFLCGCHSQPAASIDDKGFTQL